MKKYFLLMLWVVPLNLLAQQPQWELMRNKTSGIITVYPTNSDNIYINGVLNTIRPLHSSKTTRIPLTQPPLFNSSCLKQAR